MNKIKQTKLKKGLHPSAPHRRRRRKKRGSTTSPGASLGEGYQYQYNGRFSEAMLHGGGGMS